MIKDNTGLSILLLALRGFGIEGNNKGMFFKDI